MGGANECVPREVELYLEPNEFSLDPICQVIGVFPEPCYEIGMVVPLDLGDGLVN